MTNATDNGRFLQRIGATNLPDSVLEANRDEVDQLLSRISESSEKMSALRREFEDPAFTWIKRHRGPDAEALVDDFESNVFPSVPSAQPQSETALAVAVLIERLVREEVDRRLGAGQKAPASTR